MDDNKVNKLISRIFKELNKSFLFSFCLDESLSKTGKIKLKEKIKEIILEELK